VARWAPPGQAVRCRNPDDLRASQSCSQLRGCAERGQLLCTLWSCWAAPMPAVIRVHTGSPEAPLQAPQGVVTLDLVQMSSLGFGLGDMLEVAGPDGRHGS
jgi:hypothetical protein